MGTHYGIRPDRNSRPSKLLNDYSGAAAAYSLRLLDVNHASKPVVRVRRASDNAEKDFKARDVALGNVEDWVGIGNDGFVTTWYDQSGNGNDATQSTASAQPKIVDNGELIKVKNKAGIKGEGKLRLSNRVGNNENDYSYFTIGSHSFEINSRGQGSQMTFGQTGNQSFGNWIRSNNFEQRFSNGDRFSVSHNFSPNEVFITYGNKYQNIYYIGTNNIYEDNTLDVNDRGGTRGFSVDTLFNDNYYSYPYTGILFEFIFYEFDQKESKNNFENIKLNINNHYQIF